jgi:hypothetical protein
MGGVIGSTSPTRLELVLVTGFIEQTRTIRVTVPVAGVAPIRSGYFAPRTMPRSIRVGFR